MLALALTCAHTATHTNTRARTRVCAAYACSPVAHQRTRPTPISQQSPKNRALLCIQLSSHPEPHTAPHTRMRALHPGKPPVVPPAPAGKRAAAAPDSTSRARASARAAFRTQFFVPSETPHEEPRPRRRRAPFATVFPVASVSFCGVRGACLCQFCFGCCAWRSHCHAAGAASVTDISQKVLAHLARVGFSTQLSNVRPHTPWCTTALPPAVAAPALAANSFQLQTAIRGAVSQASNLKRVAGAGVCTFGTSARAARVQVQRIYRRSEARAAPNTAKPVRAI